MVANRLSEKANWTILVLEAGGYENDISDVPYLMNSPDAEANMNWGHRIEPQPNRSCIGM